MDPPRLKDSPYSAVERVRRHPIREAGVDGAGRGAVGLAVRLRPEAGEELGGETRARELLEDLGAW